MTTTWTLIKNKLPPSLNTYMRMHYHPRNDLHGAWYHDIAVLVAEQKIPPLQHADVSITLYFPTKRRRDQDNYMCTAYKLLLDALKRTVLPDDSPEHVTLHPVRLAVDPSNPRTEITLVSNGS